MRATPCRPAIRSVKKTRHAKASPSLRQERVACIMMVLVPYHNLHNLLLSGRLLSVVYQLPTTMVRAASVSCHSQLQILAHIFMCSKRMSRWPLTVKKTPTLRHVQPKVMKTSSKTTVMTPSLQEASAEVPNMVGNNSLIANSQKVKHSHSRTVSLLVLEWEMTAKNLQSMKPIVNAMLMTVSVRKKLRCRLLFTKELPAATGPLHFLFMRTVVVDYRLT